MWLLRGIFCLPSRWRPLDSFQQLLFFPLPTGYTVVANDSGMWWQPNGGLFPFEFSDVQLPRTMARINECPNPNDTGAKSKGLRQVLLLLSPQGNENEGQTSIEVTSFIAKLGQGILFLLLTNTNWALLCIDCVTSDQHNKVPETTGHYRPLFAIHFSK